MISDEPEGGVPPDFNEMIKEFEAHMSQLNAAANAKVEAAMAAMIQRVDGAVPNREEIAAKGAIVQIEGWPRVRFFVWKRNHVLAWVIDLTQNGDAAVVIKEVPREQWPSALVKSEFVDPSDG
jgi:hypothetical protein